jgi:DNA phosphorothioation-associated putative methyltransferase
VQKTAESQLGLRIRRERAAIRRTSLSRPLSLALAEAVIAPGWSVCDYGCGLGDDIANLRGAGFEADGWDPYHRPDGVRRESDVCYLGFVLNVIERPQERIDTLRAAWDLAREVLVVSALVTVDARGAGAAIPFGDGVLTRIGTFQKYFDQRELENLLRQTLDTEPVALGMGVFALFRDPTRASQFLARRVVRRAVPLSGASLTALLAARREALQPILEFFMDRGRWPNDEEFAPFQEGLQGLGPVRRIAATIEAAAPSWGLDLEARRAEVRADLSMVLALARYRCPRGTPPLDSALRREVVLHFGTLSSAFSVGDELLLSLGRPGVLRRAALASRVGKRMPEALYVHASAIARVPIELRAYEELGRAFTGGVEGANIVKLHLDRPAISYLSYPDFDGDPHPALHRSIVADLQTFRVWGQDFTAMKNPPILHRKELFVSDDFPLHDKFARLTKQEERFELYDGSTGSIGNREQWEERLRVAGVRLAGHRVVRLKM